MVEYLDLEALLVLTRRLGAGPVRDPGLLDSCAARPQATVFGADAYRALEDKAAALLHSTCRSHALADGNKRLAWLATVSFLALNGRDVVLHDDEAFDLVVAVAEGRLDVPDIAGVLAEHTAPR